MQNATSTVFCMIWSRNGPVGLANAGVHGFDTERVAIIRDQHGPTSLWLGQHNGGFHVPWSNVEMENDRPVVYVARNSHAMYPRAGKVQRWFGFGNDKCDGKGYTFDDYTVANVSSTDHPKAWDYYGGVARDNGQLLPIYRSTGWTCDFIDKLESGRKWTLFGRMRCCKRSDATYVN